MRVTFSVMKFGCYVIVDDGGNYVMFHELNVRIKIKKIIIKERSYSCTAVLVISCIDGNSLKLAFLRFVAG